MFFVLKAADLNYLRQRVNRTDLPFSKDSLHWVSLVIEENEAKVSGEVTGPKIRLGKVRLG
jgi:hypothetical protein